MAVEDRLPNALSPINQIRLSPRDARFSSLPTIPQTDYRSPLMEFIELTGKTLLDVVNEGEIDLGQLHDAGVKGDSILRINRHGEIELREKSNWTLVGGLIGNFEERLTGLTGLDW